MERRVTEEWVTKTIIQWLRVNGWTILAFDFPQSGTGRIFKSDFQSNSKNKESIIPDIIAIKSQVVTIFENKDRYYFPDFLKVEGLRVNNKYSESLKIFLARQPYNKIFYGVGLPVTLLNRGAVEKHKGKTDFIINCNIEGLEVFFQRGLIFR